MFGGTKKERKLKHIPVIMHTTSSYVKDKEETLQNGAAYFISKPASYSELKEILSVVTHNLT
jgi:CheY-like chemotaxis protein